MELEIPHIHVTAGRGSPKRQVLFEKRGRFQAPYLEVRGRGKSVILSTQSRGAMAQAAHNTCGKSSNMTSLTPLQTIRRTRTRAWPCLNQPPSCST